MSEAPPGRRKMGGRRTGSMRTSELSGFSRPVRIPHCGTFTGSAAPIPGRKPLISPAFFSGICVFRLCRFCRLSFVVQKPPLLAHDRHAWFYPSPISGMLKILEAYTSEAESSNMNLPRRLLSS